MDKNTELKLNDYLKGIVLNLPESPGIYQYLNNEGTIIYVGKAKNLKRRVSSYFNRDHGPGKTRVLVSKITDIRYIVVNTEEDALLLENNLIKKYKPRYNVLLKDDKTYPSICIQNEYFPRIFKTRRIIRNGSSYYGPYSHLPSMYAVLDLIKHLYPIRTCNLNLTPETYSTTSTSSPSKKMPMKRRLSSTTCTSRTVPSTRPSPSSTRNVLRKPRRNCSSWASSRCANATRASRAKSSCPSN